MVAKIRENIQIPRHARMEVSGNGLVAAYIHTGAKVGVLVEVGAGKESTVANDEFKQLVKDITLQIAAGHPYAVSREQVPAEVIAKEREIAAQSDRLKGKPAQALEKIIQGMLEKFYQTYCLVDQGFVKKNSEISVKEHVAARRQAIGRRNHDPPLRPLPGRRDSGGLTSPQIPFAMGAQRRPFSLGRSSVGEQLAILDASLHVLYEALARRVLPDGTDEEIPGLALWREPTKKIQLFIYRGSPTRKQCWREVVEGQVVTHTVNVTGPGRPSVWAARNLD